MDAKTRDTLFGMPVRATTAMPEGAVMLAQGDIVWTELVELRAEVARLRAALGVTVRGWVKAPGKRRRAGLPPSAPTCRYCKRPFQGSDNITWHADDCPVRVYWESVGP